jgi:hypothetical protein
VHNYTVSDILGALKAVALFSIFLFTPGYVVGWLLNLFAFRAKLLTERILLSVPLSVGFSPIIAVLLARFGSLNIAVASFVGLAIVFVGCVVYEAFSSPQRLRVRLDRPTKILIVAVGIWLIVALGVLVDVQAGNRLFPSVTAYDHSVRAALNRSILDHGVPPVNPFFFPGHTVPLRYYYYWNLLCALTSKLGNIDPRLSLYASCVWAGFALAAIIPLYLKYFIGDRVQLRAKSLLGIGLLTVTGLDLIPTAINMLTHRVDADIEGWNPSQITSWTDSCLWVPNHIVGLVACLLGFLAIWNVSSETALGERMKGAAFAALAFASAAGLSLYVSFTFGIFLVVWSFLLLHRQQWAELLMFAAAGVGAAVLSVAYLNDMRTAPGSEGFALWAVRWDLNLFSRQTGVGFEVLAAGISILALPLWYVMELGFFFAIGLLRLRSLLRRRELLSRCETAAWMMLGSSFFVASFLRSRVIAANDLGMRSALVMQFVLLLWAVPFVYDWWSNTDRAKFKTMLAPIVRPSTLLFMLILGAMASIYQAGLLRSYTFLHSDDPSAQGFARLPSSDTAGTIYGIRKAYEEIDKTLPQEAIVQYNPLTHSYYPFLLYSNRQPVSAAPGCGVSFGGKIYDCIQIQFKLTYVFNNPRWEGAKSLDAVCDKYSINDLMVTDQDPVWQHSDTWVWKRKPRIANQFVRVFSCGSRKL